MKAGEGFLLGDGIHSVDRLPDGSELITSIPPDILAGLILSVVAVRRTNLTESQRDSLLEELRIERGRDISLSIMRQLPETPSLGKEVLGAPNAEWIIAELVRRYTEIGASR